jgi:hypothetical protein
MELLQLVANHIEEVSRPLRDEVASLKLLLVRIGDSLGSSEACTSCGLGLAPSLASFPLDSTEQKSFMVEEEHLYGCFSPHSSLHPSPQPDVSVVSKSDEINRIMAPVPQITPELHELRVESSMLLPMEVGSFEALAVATTTSPLQSEPCQLPAYTDNGGVLATSSKAIFAKELCGLLASLEAASHGYDNDIARVLAGKASEDIIRKVEKSLSKVSLWNKRRKRGVVRKVSTVP